MTKTRDLADLGGGFIQVGATVNMQRTVESKLQDVVSVKDFGADPTGATNSTAAIQAALNASKLVTFPEGSYKVTDTLQVPAGTTVVGAPGSKVYPVKLVWYGNDKTKDVIRVANPGNFNTGRRGISGIAIVPNSSANLARAAISIDGPLIYVKDCTIEGISKSFLFGIEGTCFSFNISDNYVAECGIGMWFEYPDITSSVISRNYVQNCTAAGLVMIAPLGVVVNGNSFEGVIPYRIVAGNSTAFAIGGLEITGNYLYGTGANTKGILCAKDVTAALADMNTLIGTNWLADDKTIAFTPSAGEPTAIHIHSNAPIEGPVSFDGVDPSSYSFHHNFVGSTSSFAYPEQTTLQDLISNNINGTINTGVRQTRGTIGSQLRSRPSLRAGFQCNQNETILLATARIDAPNNKLIVAKVSGVGGDHFSASAPAIDALIKFYAFSSTYNVVVAGSAAGTIQIAPIGGAAILTGAGTAAISLNTDYGIYLVPGGSEAYSGDVMIYSPNTLTSYSLNTSVT
jgi:hypothetical protein